MEMELTPRASRRQSCNYHRLFFIFLKKIKMNFPKLPKFTCEQQRGSRNERNTKNYENCTENKNAAVLSRPPSRYRQRSQR